MVRESERVLARTKKGLEKNQNEVARTKKGLESAWRDYKRAIMFASKRAGGVLKLNCFWKRGSVCSLFNGIA